MSSLSTPHDRYFRETFARQEVALDFLDNYPPPELRAHLDLSTLSLKKESFVDPDLRQHFSDLLYEVETVENDPGYVYLLFEHKSYPDPLTIFQMLRYCVRIWERALRADSSLTRLPPILPLLVYHGEQIWNAPRDMIELPRGFTISRTTSIANGGTASKPESVRVGRPVHRPGGGRGSASACGRIGRQLATRLLDEADRSGRRRGGHGRDR